MCLAIVHLAWEEAFPAKRHAERRPVELGLGYYLPDRLDTFYLRSYNSILMPFGSSTKMFRVVGVNWTTSPLADNTRTPVARMRFSRLSRSVTLSDMAGAPGS